MSTSKSEITGTKESANGIFFSEYDPNHDYRTRSSILCLSLNRSKNEGMQTSVYKSVVLFFRSFTSSLRSNHFCQKNLVYWLYGVVDKGDKKKQDSTLDAQHKFY